jgi:hypothetical protein
MYAFKELSDVVALDGKQEGSPSRVSGDELTEVVSMAMKHPEMLADTWSNSLFLGLALLGSHHQM